MKLFVALNWPIIDVYASHVISLSAGFTKPDVLLFTSYCEINYIT